MENGVRPFVRPCVITCGNGAGTGIIEKLAAGPLLFLLLRYRASQLSYRTIPKRSAKNDSQKGGGGVVREGRWRESRLLAQFRSGHQIRNGRLIFARRRCGGRNIFITFRKIVEKICGRLSTSGTDGNTQILRLFFLQLVVFLFQNEFQENGQHVRARASSCLFHPSQNILFPFLSQMFSVSIRFSHCYG